MIVAYGYLMEHFLAWYSGEELEEFMIQNRMFGPYAISYWALIACNILTPQLLWLKSVRSNALPLFLVALVINVGMWLERFVIIVTSLHRDFIPSSWGMYIPTFWDWATFIGTLGLFSALLFLFIRLLPMISIFEMRELVHEHSTESNT
jgi:molybdopterin-containing oxidoreductase family membrane subunit